MANEKKIEPTAEATATAKPEEAVDPMALSISDLKGLSTIIDVATSRGAFRANEMASIGAVYNKLQAFLTKVAPTQPAGAGAPTTVAPAEAPKEK